MALREVDLSPAAELLASAMSAMVHRHHMDISSHGSWSSRVRMEGPQPSDCLRALCTLASWRLKYGTQAAPK